MHIKIWRNITLDKHSLYLDNSCCLSIRSVTDTHTDDGYIHLRVEFQCIANGHNKSDRLERTVLIRENVDIIKLHKQCYVHLLDM